MELNLILSVVSRTQSAKDRRFAIRKSWSDEEIERRRKSAIEMQHRLAAHILTEPEKTIRSRRALELAS